MCRTAPEKAERSDYMYTAVSPSLLLLPPSFIIIYYFFIHSVT